MTSHINPAESVQMSGGLLKEFSSPLSPETKKSTKFEGLSGQQFTNLLSVKSERSSVASENGCGRTTTGALTAREKEQNIQARCV